MAGAVIRANRAEVSDRFPMLGFTVRTGARPYFEAVVTTDPALLDPSQRTRRKANTFWSTRELGPLPAERGEAVLIMPDAVLQRFAGAERLYYTAVTFADRTRANAEVNRIPASALPFVTLSPSYTGRRLRQMVGGRGDGVRWNGADGAYNADNGASLEWAGDVSKLGIEPAPPGNGTASGTDEAPAAAAAGVYDDGFGDALWTESVRQRRGASTRGMSDGGFDIGWTDVPMVPAGMTVPAWLAAGGMLLGWRDPGSADPMQILQRLGGLAPLGIPSTPDAIAAIAATLDLESETPTSYTVDAFRQLLSARGPQWIGVCGVEPRFVVVTGLYGDGTPEGTYVRISDPSSQPLAPRGTPFAASGGMGSSYVLTFQQFLDAFAALAPNAGLQAIHVTEAAMKGRSALVTSQAYAAGGVNGRRRGVAQAQAAPVVVPIVAAITGATMTRILNNEGDISWELDQLKGLKHPADDAARATNANFRTVTTPVAGWPKVSGGIHEIDALADDIYADFVMEWQCNGHSVGNLAIKNTHTNDAVGWGLEVKATINDDATIYEGDCAAIRVTFNYRFTRSIGSDAIAIRNFTLYADGTYHEESKWTQKPDGWWGSEEQGLSRSYGAGAEIAKEAVEPVINWVKESLEDDISLKLPKMTGWKHVNNDPANARPANRRVQTVTIQAPVMEVTYPIPGVDDRPIRCDLIITWQYDGSSLGEIRVRPTNPNDPPGGGLNVDGEDYEWPASASAEGGQCAAVALLFNYTFTFEFDSQGRRSFDVILYGDGRYEVKNRD